MIRLNKVQKRQNIMSKKANRFIFVALFLICLTVIFTALKLYGLIYWSWIYVMTPILIVINVSYFNCIVIPMINSLENLNKDL